ncbi:hypothetical protein SGLAM104S_00210 [Streptomyces glaucescens]
MTDVLGITYVVPMSFSAIGAIYSGRTWSEIGGSVPATWSELLDLCDTAREHGKVLFALGNATPWVTQLLTYALVATAVYADQPDFDDLMNQGKRTFAASGWRTALEKYLAMNDRASAPDHSAPPTRTRWTRSRTAGQWAWCRSPVRSPPSGPPLPAWICA